MTALLVGWVAVCAGFGLGAWWRSLSAERFAHRMFDAGVVCGKLLGYHAGQQAALHDPDAVVPGDEWKTA